MCTFSSDQVRKMAYPAPCHVSISLTLPDRLVELLEVKLTSVGSPFNWRNLRRDHMDFPAAGQLQLIVHSSTLVLIGHCWD